MVSAFCLKILNRNVYHSGPISTTAFHLHGTTRPIYSRTVTAQHIEYVSNNIPKPLIVLSSCAPRNYHMYDREAQYILWLIFENFDLPRDEKKTGWKTNRFQCLKITAFHSSQYSPLKLTRNYLKRLQKKITPVIDMTVPIDINVSQNLPETE